jgi:multidrug efflux pump subunit AcrA (membrane-fusion protein)
MDRLSVKMRVLENDIQHIQQNLPITVHPDAFPKLEFAGTLTKVDQIATKTGISPTETRRFTVIGKCTDDAPLLRSGMNCRVTIHPNAVSNAILVPIVSVFEEKGKYYCYARANSTWERREVKVGLSNENMVQITEGLQEGDEVFLQKPDQG